MKIKVFFEKDNASKSVEASKGEPIESVLRHLKINPQTVIVARNGKVVTEQESVEEGDSLKIFSVKLGG